MYRKYTLSRTHSKWQTSSTILADMGALRVPADKIETLVGKDYWPYPTYSDLLFYVK